MSQAGQRHRPPATRLADHVGVGHARLGQEDLVERGPAVHLPQRARLHPALAHGQREVGDAPMLGDVPVGAGQEHAEGGQVGPGGPHLLPAHHPFVAVPLGPGREPGQVGSVAGLAEQLAPLVLAGDDGAKQAPPRVGRAVLEDGRRGQGHARPRGGTHRPDLREHLRHHRRQPVRQPPAVPLGGPGWTAPAGVGQEAPPLPERTLGIPPLLQPRLHVVPQVHGHIRAGHLSSPDQSERAVPPPGRASSLMP